LGDGRPGCVCHDARNSLLALDVILRFFCIVLGSIQFALFWRDKTMTDEEYQAYVEMLCRSRDLVDEWAELKELGPDAERYC